MGLCATNKNPPIRNKDRLYVGRAPRPAADAHVRLAWGTDASSTEQ